MEPVFMAIGHSAGVAAALANEQRRAVQEIDRAKLRAQLLAQGQIIERKAR
jgi:hypothetical protein